MRLAGSRSLLWSALMLLLCCLPAFAAGAGGKLEVEMYRGSFASVN